MIKLCGAVLLVAGTSAWGAMGVMRLRRRCRILADLVRSMAALRGELTTRLAPMPEVLERMEREFSAPVAEFFGAVRLRLDELGAATLFELWSDASERAELCLTAEERSVLRDAGRTLGRYDIDEQRAALERAERELTQLCRRAEQRCDRDSRTRAFVGVAVGLFATLLLI